MQTTTFIRLIASKKYVKLDNKQMVITGAKVLAASLIACIIPRIIFWIHPINKYILLVVSAIVGVTIYLGMVKILKVHEINDVINLLNAS